MVSLSPDTSFYPKPQQPSSDLLALLMKSLQPQQQAQPAQQAQQPSSQQNLPVQQQSASTSDELDKYSAMIKDRESGGNYRAQGPRITNPNSAYYGDRAYGAHQVMGKNIPEWTQEAFGKPMTVAEFVNNPQAQEALFRFKFGQYLGQTGSPRDAASMWFSGKPFSQGQYKSDYQPGQRGGTTGTAYASGFPKAMSYTAGGDDDPLMQENFPKAKGEPRPKSQAPITVAPAGQLPASMYKPQGQQGEQEKSAYTPGGDDDPLMQEHFSKEQPSVPVAQGTVPVQQSSPGQILQQYWPEAAGVATATLPGMGAGARAVGGAALAVAKSPLVQKMIEGTIIGEAMRGGEDVAHLLRSLMGK